MIVYLGLFWGPVILLETPMCFDAQNSGDSTWPWTSRQSEKKRGFSSPSVGKALFGALDLEREGQICQEKTPVGSFFSVAASGACLISSVLRITITLKASGL